MTQKQAGRIVAVTAKAQQILRETLRPVEFATERVISRLPIGHPKELRGGTQLLPQLSCAGKGLARFSRRLAFDPSQHRA